MSASASFPALGSTAVVATSQDDRSDHAVVAVQRTVAAFDRACSRFREDSELSAVNRAAGRPVRVSPLLIEAVMAGLRAAELTDGDVDPSLGRALVALGYDRDFFNIGLGGQGAGGGRGPVGSGVDQRAYAAVPGWRAIRVDSAAGTVSVPVGVALDLGATAKALCCDHCAAAALDAAGCGVLVGLGGDFAVAGGAPADGWPVRVTDDHQADLAAPGQWVTVRVGGLATSSTAVRRWRGVDGEDVHHLLDPATGRPARGGWRTVTVTAASCLDANIASTAAIVRGWRATRWLTDLRLPSRLVTDQGAAVHIAGWPADGEELAVAAAAGVAGEAGAGGAASVAGVAEKVR